MEAEVSNFYFRECKAPLADSLARFMIKSRAGIQFTPKRKHDILNQGNGICECVRVGSLKHIISCCPIRAALMTKRHNNVARILVQAVEANHRKELIKSSTGQFIHWNQEIRLPDNILNPRREPKLFEENAIKRRPDFCFYTIKRKDTASSLKLNIIEVRIP
jgi:hypothetical protein